MRHFWRPPNLSLINFEIELELSCSRNSILPAISRTAALATSSPNLARTATKTTGTTFQIKSAKLYVPVVNLPLSDNIKSLENKMQGLKRRASWNKRRSKITKEPKTNSLDYMIDQKFRNINRLFVFLFKSSDSGLTRIVFILVTYN